MYSPSVKKLIDLFSKFPTVGPRTASRFTFHLIRLPKEEIDDFLTAVAALRHKVKACPSCFNSFESVKDLCEICANPIRDKSLLCVVANETDLDTLEKIKKYKGLYFVLGGQVSRLKKDDLGKLRIKELEERLKKSPEIKEIILALNPTTEGEVTALYLERILKPFCATQGKKTTRLGRGLPVGGELEYADEETLLSALEGRK